MVHRIGVVVSKYTIDRKSKDKQHRQCNYTQREKPLQQSTPADIDRFLLADNDPNAVDHLILYFLFYMNLNFIKFSLKST
jgi:hypothetical protein